MDEQEREKLFQEIRARIGDAEMEVRRVREDELTEEANRKKDWHWSLKLLAFVGVLCLSFFVYLFFARMGWIW